MNILDVFVVVDELLAVAVVVHIHIAAVVTAVVVIAVAFDVEFAVVGLVLMVITDAGVDVGAVHNH